jgi:hypothetical protein
MDLPTSESLSVGIGIVGRGRDGTKCLCGDKTDKKENRIQSGAVAKSYMICD